MRRIAPLPQAEKEKKISEVHYATKSVYVRVRICSFNVNSKCQSILK